MFYLSRNDLGVQRSTGLIDIATIGAGMGDDDLATKIREELWSDRRGGSVRTIDDNAASIEGEPRNSGEQEANIFSAIGLVDRRRNYLLWSHSQDAELTEYLLFNC